MINTKPYAMIQNTLNKGCHRTQELNTRLYERNIPSQPLQPAFSMRPAETKHTIFPIFDRRPRATVPIIKQSDYCTSSVFNPGTNQAPWSGFAKNINTESTLRNQFFALQKANQASYIPDSKSELYNGPSLSLDPTNPVFKHIHSESKFSECNPNTLNISNKIFNNCTRQDLKSTQM